MANPLTECRWYENVFPEMDEVVMVQVKSIAEMGAYVSLLEYNNIEGMILLSELSRKRIRSITKLIKVGKQEPVMVLRVDRDKGYIDLSKRRVSPEEAAACEDRYNRGKLVAAIMRHVAETTGVSLEELNSQFTWPLHKMYGDAVEALKAMVQEPAAVLKRLQDETNGGAPLPLLTENVLEAILKNIKRKLTPQPIKIRAEVEMTCFAYDGLLHIQNAMRAAEATSTEGCEVKMKLIAPPLYVLTTSTLDKVKVLTAACEACKEAVEGCKGRLVIKEAPRTVSDREDKLLQEKLEQLDKQNAEVDGDDGSDGDSYEEGMGDVDLDAPSGLTVA